MNDLALSIQGLKKVYKNGTKALDGVDLTIEQGDFFALLGANGAGKTTTIGILTSLVNKNEGKVSVFGHDLDTQINDVKFEIGVVPQEFNFSIFEKVFDIVWWQSGYYGVSPKEGKQRAEALLKVLGLWDKAHVRAKELSGGMKRRLMIARALVHNPRLLILDEPTAGVDVELRHGMWSFLKKLNESGTTILLTTHYLEEVEQLCRNVALLKDGKVLTQQSVPSLLRSLEMQTYTVDVCKTPMDLKLSDFPVRVKGEQTLEVDVESKQPITHLIEALHKAGVLVNDIRPKDSRMEQLYMQLLAGKSPSHEDVQAALNS